MNDGALPDWLTKNSSYTPLKDHDAFVDKSILALLRILSKIKQQGTLYAPKKRAHAGFKLTQTFLLVVLIALSNNTLFISIVIAGILCRLSLLPGEKIAKILKSSLAATMFTAVILLPAGLVGNWYSMALITPKVFASVSVLSFLSYGTPWADLTAAMKFIFIPDIFIFVLDIAIKYIFLLGDFSLQMLYALKMRSIGKNSQKNTSLSGIAGILFLRSREMAEEMHSAMECRGFTGEYHKPVRLEINRLDLLLLVLSTGLILLFLYLNLWVK